MNKYFLALLIVAALSSCGVKIQSVVDSSAIKTPYVNPLIVIPYDPDVTENFTTLLKQKIEEKFRSDSLKVEILLVEQYREKLKLNATSDIDARINDAISSDGKDLILIFKPNNMQFYNGDLQSATYIISGTDLKSNKEVWKAEFTSSSTFGPSLFAEKAAARIYEKLKGDRII